MSRDKDQQPSGSEAIESGQLESAVGAAAGSAAAAGDVAAAADTAASAASSTAAGSVAPAPAPATPATRDLEAAPTNIPYAFDMDSRGPAVSAPDDFARETYELDANFSPITVLQKIQHFYYLIWAIIGCVVLGIGAWYLLGQMTMALAVIVVAALVVFILRSPVDWMQARGVPRWAGSLIAYVLLLACVTLAGLVVIPMLARQLIELVTQIPFYITSLEDAYISLLENNSDNIMGQLVHSTSVAVNEWALGFVSYAPERAITIGANLANAALTLFISLVAGYWVLKDLPTIKLEVRRLINPQYRDDMSFVSSAFSRALSGYLKGMAIAGTCVGIFTSIGFTILGLPYPALLGLVAGLMMFVPIVGPWISGVVVGIFGFLTSPITGVLAIVVVIIAVQLTDYLIVPRVMSSAVELHPAIILVGVLAGGALAGVPGLIAAIPLLAAAKSIFVYYFEKTNGRKIAFSDGAIFKRAEKTGDKTTVQAARDLLADSILSPESEDALNMPLQFRYPPDYFG